MLFKVNDRVIWKHRYSKPEEVVCNTGYISTKETKYIKRDVVVMLEFDVYIITFDNCILKNYTIDKLEVCAQDIELV